jgi:hypothetical protein
MKKQTMTDEQIKAALSKLPIEELREIAQTRLQRGELWLPRVEARHGGATWYWIDREETCGTRYGTFESEQRALIDAIEQKGLDEEYSLEDTEVDHSIVTGVELCIEAVADKPKARRVDDMAWHLRQMWSILTPAQKLLYMGNARVQETIGREDQERAFDQLVIEQRNVIFETGGASPLMEKFIAEFPGLAFQGREVDGSDVVDFVNDLVSATYPFEFK